GDDDLAIGVVTTDAVELLFVDAGDGALTLDAAPAPALTPVLADSIRSFRLAAGNLDRDRGEELAVVLNEQAAAEDGGVAQYAIFDDATSGRGELKADRVEVIAGGV